jgi:hypothetical protein
VKHRKVCDSPEPNLFLICPEQSSSNILFS